MHIASVELKPKVYRITHDGGFSHLVVADGFIAKRNDAQITAEGQKLVDSALTLFEEPKPRVYVFEIRKPDTATKWLVRHLKRRPPGSLICVLCPLKTVEIALIRVLKVAPAQICAETPHKELPNRSDGAVNPDLD